ncbi:MAG: NADH-quinone oxidoreductase subunit J [Promicromonosporaceae bacterium]|nr:NADH-quinone oxidoreductase subunit J [Promicromonosporaceae bacterium]
MTTSAAEAVLFWCLAPLMVAAAVGLLVVRRAVHAAVCVVGLMISVAVLYIANQAPFLGVVQVVVYTGAVMMLFLFVLMLVGVDSADSLVETIKGQRGLGVTFGIGLLVILLSVLAHTDLPEAIGLTTANQEGNPNALAEILYGQYALAMVVVGVLLVTAALAGLVLTHRARIAPRLSQRELSSRRVAARPGALLAPPPAPGVYAQNNAMDTPALGPDGRPIEESVSRVLRIRGQARDAGEVAGGREAERLTAGHDHLPMTATGVVPPAHPAPHPGPQAPPALDAVEIEDLAAEAAESEASE